MKITRPRTVQGVGLRQCRDDLRRAVSSDSGVSVSTGVFPPYPVLDVLLNRLELLLEELKLQQSWAIPHTLSLMGLLVSPPYPLAQSLLNIFTFFQTTFFLASFLSRP